LGKVRKKLVFMCGGGVLAWFWNPKKITARQNQTARAILFLQPQNQTGPVPSP
jgi:hypothetical protein